MLSSPAIAGITIHVPGDQPAITAAIAVAGRPRWMAGHAKHSIQGCLVTGSAGLDVRVAQTSFDFSKVVKVQGSTLSHNGGGGIEGKRIECEGCVLDACCGAGAKLTEVGKVTGPWSELGVEVAGLAGTAQLSGSGSLLGGSILGIQLTLAPASTPVTLVIGPRCSACPSTAARCGPFRPSCCPAS
jgi:hypothetical protein